MCVFVTKKHDSAIVVVLTPEMMIHPMLERKV